MGNRPPYPSQSAGDFLRETPSLTLRTRALKLAGAAERVKELVGILKGVEGLTGSEVEVVSNIASMIGTSITLTEVHVARLEEIYKRRNYVKV